MSNRQIQAHMVSCGYRPECYEFVLVSGYQFAIHIPEYLGKLVLKLPPPAFLNNFFSIKVLMRNKFENLEFFIIGKFKY